MYMPWLQSRTTIRTVPVWYHNAYMKSTEDGMKTWYYGGDQPQTTPDFRMTEENLYTEYGVDRKLVRRCEHRKVFDTLHSAQIPWRSFWGSATDWWVFTPYVTPYWVFVNTRGAVGSTLFDDRIGDWTNLETSRNPMWRGDLPGVDRVIDPPGLSNLLANALQSTLPKIKPTLSLLNSLYELKDFKSFPRLLQECKALARKLTLAAANVNYARKLSKIKTFKQLAKAANNGFLSWEFAVEPLVRDIQGLANALSDARKQLTRLTANANRRQRLHYSVILSDNYKPTSTSVEYFVGLQNQTGDFFKMEKRTEYPVKLFTFTVEYSYDLSSIAGIPLQMAFLLDQVGFNLNPAVIWNALPFSFVIDWVINLNGFFNSFAKTNVNINTRIHQACWSLRLQKWDRLILLKTKEIKSAAEVLNTQAEWPLRDIYTEVYKRVPVDVSEITTLRTSGLSLKESVLAASLGISQVLR